MSTDSVFKAMADPTRQRIMQVLLQHEFSVTELVDVLRQPQSTVSRHLKVLRDAELISDRRNGVTVHYAPSAAAVGGDNDALPAHLVRWLEQQPVPTALQRRIARVLENRHAETVSYFEGIGQRWDQMRTDCFGPSFHLEALTALLPRTWVVADIGTGTGYLLPALAAAFAKVIAIEPVATLMEAARSRPELRAASNVEFRAGDLRQLPLADGEVDLAVAVLVLHHVPEPAAALAEIGRAVQPGGRVLIVEQQAHRCEAFHELMQDRWWGFEPEALARQVEAAGFTGAGTRVLRSATSTSAAAPETPELFVMTGEKTA
jgi:ubiquinone/menaquinone biosynthesis C-methylase UbiE